MTIGKAIGFGFITARDFLARGLVRLGVTPNGLTMAGMVITAGAGVCYALGAGSGFAATFDIHNAPGWPADDPQNHPHNAWLLLAGVLLLLASACDMLDGAVARMSNKKTTFGAFLDSTLDRFSDFVVYAGIAVYYAAASPANVTYCLLAMLAFFNSFMISYTRARAEDLIDHCTIGYWQRGERSAAILIGTFAYNVPAILVQQGLSTLFTALRRMSYTQSVLAGRVPIEDPRLGGWWLKVRLWRWPRMTWAYDLVTGINIAFLIFAPIPWCDPLGAWLR